MPERDFVGEIIKYSFSGVIPMEELYKAIFKWAKLYGYKVIEKEHKTALSLERKDYVFNWTIERKPTDYIKFKIDTEVKVKSLKEVKTKAAKKKYYKGDIDFMLIACFEKDYEDAFGKNPLIKFTREVFDKYLTESKMQRLEKELLRDRDKLLSEIKAFLEVQRLKTAEEEK